MSCEYCTDPDGVSCFPIYGVGPHTHEGRDGNPLLGATVPVPREEWPENYRENPAEPGHGAWWCPHCGDGKPADLPANVEFSGAPHRGASGGADCYGTSG